jgi:TolB-like protein/DNA-binding winged helix-turn-helix (wHTH) protein/Tfp pilus assembly protein PilF
MDRPLERDVVARFQGFELDSRSGELRFKGERIPLQEKPLRILQRLVDCPGDVVTRDELRQSLWSADTFVDFDGGLNTAVNKLRTALGDSALQPRFIETVGRRGYRFLAPVEADHRGPSAEELRLDEDATPPAAAIAAGTVRRRRLILALCGAAALAASLLAWQALRSRSREGVPVIRSIAVIPLANVSEKAEEEYFADGMTDALITDLAEVRSLRVISRQSVMRYKASRKSLAEVGRELGVEVVIEGTVLRSRDRVRVTAQLVHVPSDRHLWARSYERDIGDVVALQGELARAIVREVRAEVAPAEGTPAATRREASNPEAYDLYLRGRYLFNRRGTDGDAFAENLKKALGYLQQAVAKDPGFAPAHGALAEAYAVAGYSGILPRAEVYPRVMAAIHDALALDPNLVEAHTVLAGALAFAQRDWPGGEREYKRALELDPTYSNAREWYCFYLAAMGRHDEHLEHARRGLEVDPFNVLLNASVGDALAHLGRSDEAVAHYRRTLDLEPRLNWVRDDLARLYSQMGRHEEAIAEARKTGSRVALAEVYARAGRRDEARRLLAEFKALTPNRYVAPLAVASVHAALGEKDQAFDYLEGAYQAGVTALSHVKVEPGLDSLRSDPRFADLLRRMSLD